MYNTYQALYKNFSISHACILVNHVRNPDLSQHFFESFAPKLNIVQEEVLLGFCIRLYP